MLVTGGTFQHLLRFVVNCTVLIVNVDSVRGFRVKCSVL